MTKRYLKQCLALLTIAVASTAAVPTQAGVIIEGTRVIYPAQARQVSVNLSNDDKRLPRLVQVWVDNGDEKLAPENLDVPFDVTPPVFRLEAGASQSLRVVYTGEPLPGDKESVFWLNALDVPPSSDDAADKNTLQFAFRIRIKLFFRPKGLAGSAAAAPRQLEWTLVKDGAGKALEAHNPTPYYVSFQKVALALGGRLVKSDETSMVAPGGKLRFPLKENVDVPPRKGEVRLSTIKENADAKAEVRFSTINDYGGFVPASAPLKPAA